MATVLSHPINNGRTPHIRERFSTLLLIILGLSQVFLSEGYCFLMDYFQVACYPSSNRISRNAQGARSPEVNRSIIKELGKNEAREMTGFTKNQLFLLAVSLSLYATLNQGGYLLAWSACSTIPYITG